MTDQHPVEPAKAHWSIEDIPYHRLDPAAVAQDDELFYLVASASFLEITTDVYTRNLIHFFAGDAEIETWLKTEWEQEELQHGAALRRYVELAWPDFDWEPAYRRFYADFQRFCALEQLEPTRGQEMAARCVVETGTAAFYRTLAAASPEPVLSRIAGLIAADEVRHYKHFYRYFNRYRASEHLARRNVFKTLWTRVFEVDDEDAFYAFKHVFIGRHPDRPFRRADYRAFRRAVRRRGRTSFPAEMATRMLLKPLGLGNASARVVLPAATAAAKLLLA